MDDMWGLKRREGTLGVDARSMREMRAVVSRPSALAVTRGGRIYHRRQSGTAAWQGSTHLEHGTHERNELDQLSLRNSFNQFHPGRQRRQLDRHRLILETRLEPLDYEGNGLRREERGTLCVNFERRFTEGDEGGREERREQHRQLWPIL